MNTEKISDGWNAFDELTSVAQAETLGTIIWENEPKIKAFIQRKFGADFEPEQAEFLVMGLNFLDVVTPPMSENAALLADYIRKYKRVEAKALARKRWAVDAETEKHGSQLGCLSKRAWRLFYAEILKSAMDGGWFWRSILQDAFVRSLANEDPILFRHERLHARGRTTDINYLRRQFVMYAYYKAGQERPLDPVLKELEKVAPVGLKALNSWEKSVKATDSGKEDLRIASLAGDLKAQFSSASAEQVHKMKSTPEKYSLTEIRAAEHAWKQLSHFDLEEFSNQYRKAHQR